MGIVGGENRGFADLHVHTRHSDGDLTTLQLVTKAIGYGLRAMAITDHDSIAAYEADAAVLEGASRQGLDILPGIEISTKEQDGTQRHILGYAINPGYQPFKAFLAGIQSARTVYTQNVCQSLEAGGWKINYDVLYSGGGTITKAHIARNLLADPRNARLCQKYTGQARPSEGLLIESTLIAGQPFFVPRQDHVSPIEAITTIHEAGGVAVVAHPSFSIMRGEPLEELCDTFLKRGIDGFEATYVQYDRSNADKPHEHRRELEAFCQEHDLIATGGSDYHTSNESRLGTFIDLGFQNHPWQVSYDTVAAIRARADRYRS